MKRKVNRRERIADLIQQSLATTLMREIGDPRFQHVTITGVTVSSDLSHAKIFASALVEHDEIKPIIKALNHAAKWFRHRLAQDIKLRIVPELRFVYDESIAHGYRISALIKSATKPNNNE